MASCNLLQVQAGKEGKPFFLDTTGTWSPWTMVICSDSCDNPQFKPMSQKHLVTEARYCITSELSASVGHRSPLFFTKKGAMQLKQLGFCLLYLTNTWLCVTFKWVTYSLARGLMYLLPHRLQHSVLWSLCSSNSDGNQMHFGAGAACRGFSCLPWEKGQKFDHYSKCSFLKSLTPSYILIHIWTSGSLLLQHMVLHENK